MSSFDLDKLMAKAEKKFTGRTVDDWITATALYEQAAHGYRLEKKLKKAKEAFIKASKGNQRLSLIWNAAEHMESAAKHMESAALLAKELGKWNEVADFYKRASELYNSHGRPQPASDALEKAARLLEDIMPDTAVQLYTDACGILEENGKEQMAFDLYRAVTRVYIKMEKYNDAAAFMLKLGVAADKCQFKAYLSAIILHLYAHDIKEAKRCYNDFSHDQGCLASELLAAYTKGDVEEIKRLGRSSKMNHLDNVIIKLARELPTGDVSALKNNAAEEEEPLDENDLT